MTEAELEQWALLSNWHAKRSTTILYDATLITHNGGDYSGVPVLKVITQV